VKEHLAPFLPSPHVAVDPTAETQSPTSPACRLHDPPHTIGRLGAWHGNFGVLLRAYAYILSLGGDGLRSMSGAAVLNANYVRARLKDAYDLAHEERTCMHEALFSAKRQKAQGVKALDVAKRLIDYGYHPPTMYFPLVVEEALLVEPTESESKETLDAFCDAMLAIAKEAETDPDLVRGAPHTAPLRRLDEATAARKPKLRW
jgi:glycine dehydrogenase subunit 2